ncbi:MAG: hypothetical protein Fur0023_16380 [Bacteroidia bacterium]
MKIIKGLFNTENREEKKEQISNTVPVTISNSFIEYWYEEGRNKGRNHGGSETGLITCIKKIDNTYREIFRTLDEIDEKKRSELKKPILIKIEEYKNKNVLYENRLKKIKEEEIPKIKAVIENLNREIHDIRQNPQHYTNEKISKAGIIFGGVILFFLTIYLFVFYSSASYSAFFKEFNLNDIGVANTIFDPQAISKAWNDGLTELILILTIPFVFLGLGYLIHKFQEEKSWKKYPKIIMLIIVTFAFDSILAYEISEKIYNIKAANSFQSLPPYSISMAIESVTFWLIIFAGFVVYLIWGFVFDFFMEAYEKLDHIRALIKERQEKIKEKQTEINKLEEEINKLNYKIGENNTEIEKLKKQIELIDKASITREKLKTIELAVMKFLDGWLEYLHYDRKSEEVREKAHQIVNKFIEMNIKPLKDIFEPELEKNPLTNNQQQSN